MFIALVVVVIISVIVLIKLDEIKVRSVVGKYFSAIEDEDFDELEKLYLLNGEDWDDAVWYGTLRPDYVLYACKFRGYDFDYIISNWDMGSLNDMAGYLGSIEVREYFYDLTGCYSIPAIDELATMSVKVTWDDGSNEHFIMALARYGGDWKIWMSTSN